MEEIRNWFSKYVFDMSGDQSSPQQIHDTIISGISLKGSASIILFCAIIIASVGLNTNSNAVVIGAMLISPLMGTIIAMGYGIAIYDLKLIKKASLSFLTQISIALLASILYFSISPTTIPTQELINRTEPSFFDFMIAFFGGSAGIIASTRKEKTNVIPGVAIATALMPPLCTVGYGIANNNIEFVFGPLYLFLINTFFIILSTLFFCNFFKLKRVKMQKKSHSIYIKRIILAMLTLISIPLLLSAATMSIESIQAQKVANDLELYVTYEINRYSENIFEKDTNVIFKEIKDNNSINLYLLGDKYTTEEVAIIKEKRKDYNLENYRVNIYQGADESLYQFFKNREK